MTRRLSLTVATAAMYVGVIVAANWAVAHLQPIPVGFGQSAPAGVLLAGVAFTCRDLLQEVAGMAATIAAILLGAGLSVALSSPALAVASGAAFLLSELADMAVYTPLRNSGRTTAALGLSNTVGAAIDSALFLWLAFGSLTFFAGQMLGKTYMTLPFILAVAIWRRRREQSMA